MNISEFIVMLNGGHGSDTKGKCSDEFDAEMKARYGIDRLYEYAYNRKVVLAVKERLEAEGFNVVHINPETTDVPLAERVRRANKYCASFGVKKCIYVSVHNNASNGSGWTNASGYTAYIANNASTRSKWLASIFERKATELDMLGNRWKQTFTYNYYELRNTQCPAILTESAFFTNKEQVRWMLSDEGFETIVRLHVESIKEYFEKILN